MVEPSLFSAGLVARDPKSEATGAFDDVVRLKHTVARCARPDDAGSGGCVVLTHRLFR